MFQDLCVNSRPWRLVHKLPGRGPRFVGSTIAAQSAAPLCEHFLCLQFWRQASNFLRWRFVPSRRLFGVEEQRKLEEPSEASALVKACTSFLTCFIQVLAYFYLQGDIDRVNYEERSPETLSEGGSSPLASSSQQQSSLCDAISLVNFSILFQSVSPWGRYYLHFIDPKWQR